MYSQYRACIGTFSSYEELIMKIVQVIIFVIGCFLSAQLCVAGETTHEFKKNGFTIDMPSVPTLYCDKSLVDNPPEPTPTKTFGEICKNRVNSDLFVQVGWSVRANDNTDLSLLLARKIVWISTNQVLNYNLVCNNRTGIEFAVGSPFYPNGQNFNSTAFSCKVSVAGGASFTIIYYFFSISRIPENVVHWITISDANSPGTATVNKMIEIAKGIQKIQVKD